MKLWATDEELSALIRRELFTAVVGDCLDKIGLPDVLHLTFPDSPAR